MGHPGDRLEWLHPGVVREGNGVLRLREDPFSIMATAVPAAGAVTADHGVRRVVRG